MDFKVTVHYGLWAKSMQLSPLKPVKIVSLPLTNVCYLWKVPNDNGWLEYYDILLKFLSQGRNHKKRYFLYQQREESRFI